MSQQQASQAMLHKGDPGPEHTGALGWITTALQGRKNSQDEVTAPPRSWPQVSAGFPKKISGFRQRPLPSLYSRASGKALDQHGTQGGMCIHPFSSGHWSVSVTGCQSLFPQKRDFQLVYVRGNFQTNTFNIVKHWKLLIKTIKGILGNKYQHFKVCTGITLRH